MEPAVEFWNIWAQWGLAGLVIGFSLWRDWHRERELSNRLEGHEHWVRERLLAVIERNTEALARVQHSCKT